MASLSVRGTLLQALLVAVIATSLGCAEGDQFSGHLDATVRPSDGAVNEFADGSDAASDVASSVDGPSGCSSNADCDHDPRGPVCEPVSGRCVVCTTASDPCPPGQFCNSTSYTCETGCNTDADCASLTHCNPSSHACEGCAADSDCSPGTVCAGGSCVAGCNAGHACGVGNACCGTACVNEQADVNNCGACGTVCPSSGGASACCMGVCTATGTDVNNCGGCHVSCAPAHATGACMAGACAIGACAAGWADCNANPADGCEVSLADDPSNCGACGTACPTGPNSVDRCVAGVCVLMCTGGYGHCASDPAGTCGTPLGASVTDCGACGMACPTGPNATPTCTTGACGMACAMGYGDCDGDPADGCEVNLATSAANCGACGANCALPNAVAGCSAGMCVLATCLPGYADCDGLASNGCETVTSADNGNCGGCGVACPAGTACSSGSCASVCGAGTEYCSGRCVTTALDISNCGACGNVCPTGSEATATCAGGACGVSCAAGYGDCDGIASDGCETSLRTDVGNCGACGAACVRANAATACVDGTCQIAGCNAGYANCSGSTTTGCETNTSNNVVDCGSCGNVCALPNAGARCSGGVCSISMCSPEYADCDGNPADGCEVYLASDNFNCGACGVMCSPGTACAGGTCSSICTGSTTYCAGSCVDLGSDLRNCGACGRVCSASQTCTAGTCVAVAPANATCAGAQVISLATPSVTISTTTIGAGHTMTAPCDVIGGTDYSGANVFFTFTIPGPAPEMVYADSIGSSFDTILFFANNCSTAIGSSTTAGDEYCDDDIFDFCSTVSLQSEVFALLQPGVHYLVLSGYASASGTATLHFQHLPVGNGALVNLPLGSSTRSGTTAGTGRVVGSCGGNGPENSYWWATCPEDAGGAFSASTCTGTAWDTLIYVKDGNGVGDTCDDDGCGVTGLESSIASTVSAGAGLHVFYVDGWATTSYGPYTVSLTRP